MENKKITLSEEELQAKIDESLNKYKSDSEAWVQKLIAENKLKDAVLDSVWDVAANPASLIDLYEDNEDVANEILRKYYWWQSIDDFKSSIDYKEDPSQLTDKKIQSEANRIYNENKYEETLESFIDKVWLEGDQLEEFNQEMEDRKSMKSYDPKKLNSYIKKAYKYVSWATAEEINKINTARAVTNASTMWSGNKKSWESKDNSASKEVKAFLNAYMD